MGSGAAHPALPFPISCREENDGRDYHQTIKRWNNPDIKVLGVSISLSGLRRGNISGLGSPWIILYNLIYSCKWLAGKDYACFVNIISIFPFASIFMPCLYLYQTLQRWNCYFSILQFPWFLYFSIFITNVNCVYISKWVSNWINTYISNL